MHSILRKVSIYYFFIITSAVASAPEFNFSIDELEKHPEHTQEIIEFNRIADTVNEEMYVKFGKEKFQTHILNGEASNSTIKGFKLIKNEGLD